MSEDKKKYSVPEPTVKRLSYYVVYLQKLLDNGFEMVSSTKIAEELSFDPTQVRKDLQFTGIMGQPKVGFQIEPTINAIKECLHWEESESAFLIGVGNLGRAILNYESMKNLGVKIVAAFENDPKKIGTSINGVEILNIERLVVLSKLMKVKVGIIAVPEAEAQKVADILVAGGVSAIWNLLPCRLKVPKNIIVEEAHLLQSLAVLTNKLALLKKNLY